MSRDRTVRVVVVDDHPLFRAGVTQSLGLDPAIEVVDEGGSGAEAIELARRHAPDVVLLDISMPGNGIDAAATISGHGDRPRILMLTVSGDGHDIMRAIDAGAAGYVLKGAGATDLIAAVKSVAAGESFLSPNLSLNLLATLRGGGARRTLAALSPREQRILRLVAQGLSNREVGERLDVQEKTVKYHMTNILKKLKVRNRVEAAMLVRDDGA